MLILNIFGTLFWCFHCWLWTSEYWMGPFRKFPKSRIPEKSGKSRASWPFKRLLPTCKFFKGDHWIVPELKQLVTQTNHNKNLIFLMAEIALRYTVKASFANLYKQTLFVKLLFMLTDEGMSLKYINILFSLWTRIAHAFFRRNLILGTLAVTKIYTKFLKVKIRFSHILIIWPKDFIIHQLHKKSNYNQLK